jgi:hypothetical protein
MRLSSVARELGVVPRTINRWLEDPSLDFPRPLIIKGRHFYDSREIDGWRARQVGRVSAPAVQSDCALPQPARTTFRQVAHVSGGRGHAEPADVEADAAVAFLKAELADGAWHNSFDIEAKASDVGITRENIARARTRLSYAVNWVTV